MDGYHGQRNHRQGLEQKVIDHDIEQSRRGLNIGGGLALAMIVCALLLGLSGQPWLAAAFLGVPACGMISTFVYGSKSRRDEREKKAAEIERS